MARDPYEILGIARDATLREAAAAYRRMAELYHPDRLREYRREVQDEGERRLREASQAIRTLRARRRGPLVAPGRERASGRGHASSSARGGSEAPVRSTGGGHVPPSPSDAAAAQSARVFYVGLRAVDGPAFHARWAGPHAEATLTALKKGHRLDGGPIRQIEWGTYSALLEGDATRRLLDGVRPGGNAWLDHVVDIVTGDLLPAPVDGAPTLTIGGLLDLIDDATWYEVLADAY